MTPREPEDLKNRSVDNGQGQESDRAGDFEHRDISASLLVKTIVFMAVFVPLCLVLLWWLMSTVWQEPVPPPSPFDQPQAQTPAPRLQASPTHDYRAFRQRMDQHLNSYGWADRDARLVHVPIATAKQRLLEQGLANRDQPPPPSRMPDKRQELTPRDVLPPDTKKENVPIRNPQQPLRDSRPLDSRSSGSQRQEAP